MSLLQIDGEKTETVLARAEEKMPLAHVSSNLKVEPKATGPVFLGNLSPVSMTNSEKELAKGEAVRNILGGI